MQNSNSNPPQTSLLLRVFGGGYLMYLAWDMRAVFADGQLYMIIAAVVFALVGAILLGHSLWKLVRHEYFRKDPAPEMESTEDWEESSNE